MLVIVIVGIRSAEHSLRSHVGIGSESHAMTHTIGITYNDTYTNLYFKKSSERGCATLRVVEYLAVTQCRSMSFKITPLIKLCVSSY